MKYMEKKITIADIARVSGVSKTTISRFLNGKYEYMSPETRERIKTIINMTKYRPNNLARSLKSKKSKVVGIVIADIESPFSASLIKGIGDALRDVGYNMLIANSDNNVEIERKNIESLIENRVEGLIVNTVDAENRFLIEAANSGLPVTLCDRFVRDYTFDISYIDCNIAIKTAMAHLFQNGFSRVHFFSQPPEHISPRYMRRETFMRELRSKGLHDPERYTHIIDISEPKSTLTQIKDILGKALTKGKAPPALIASSGVVLIHVVSAVLSLGYKMPEDVGVCGFDDWGWPEHMRWTPILASGITTLEADVRRTGSVAVEFLLNRIADNNTPKHELEIPAALRIRNSTKRNA
jgi:LacI family kdg operon repressor